MIRGSAFSASLHGLLIAAAFFGLPNLIDFEQDEPTTDQVQIPVAVGTPEQVKDIDKAAARPLAEMETSAGGKSGLTADATDTEMPADRQTLLQSASASSDRTQSAESKTDELVPSTDPTPTRDAVAEERPDTTSPSQQTPQLAEAKAGDQAPALPPQALEAPSAQAIESSNDAVLSHAPTSLLPRHPLAPPQDASSASAQKLADLRIESPPQAVASAASPESRTSPEQPQSSVIAESKPSPSAATALAKGDEIARTLVPLVAALPRIDDTLGEIISAQFRDDAAAKVAAESEPASQKSIERLESAAEQGYAAAQFDLAEIYLTGDGRPRDVEKGTQYLQRASLNGYVPAQLLNAALAAEGSVVPRDLAEAQAWFAAAADQGSTLAADAMKQIEPQLTVRDNVRVRQRRSQLRQIFVLSQPKAGERLAPRPDDQLRIATTLGDVEAVYVQLGQGGDPNKPDQDGRTASIEAAWRGYVKILDALIEKGANAKVVDGSGKTPLIWAAVNGQAATVERLLAAQVPVDVQDQEGITALMRAAWNGHADVVGLLLQAKANPRLRDRSGKTALDYAVQAHDAETLRLLQAASRT